MIVFKDSEMQMRYESIVDRDLEKIFDEFSRKCKREQITMLPRFSGEKGVSLLKERAQDKGYVLGSKIHLQNGMDIADIETVDFVVEPSISISRGSMIVDGKWKRKWEKLPNPMLCGLGVEMCLLGWSKFIGLTCTDISAKLKEGISIDDMISLRKKTNDTRKVICNGKPMAVREALKLYCIPYFEYMNMLKMRGVDEASRQSVFDELAEKHKCESQRGVLKHFGRTWLSISEDDYSIIQSIATNHAITEQQALHLLITENQTKGE